MTDSTDPPLTVGDRIARDLQRTLRILVAATVLLYLAMAGALVYVRHDSAQHRDALAREANRTRVALCTLRGDLERRVSTSREFLAANPNGIPGIPATTLKQSISNQQATVDALAALRC